jgi:dipeptidyl aminopeptidase/acylaminoacyl peptidase
MPHEGQTGITFESGGYKLLGSLFLAKGDDPKPTALILHGIPGIEKNYDLAQMLREIGWNSLIFHYRGCWGSEGDYTLRTIPEDVRAAVDLLSSGAHRQIDIERLVFIGHSIGGWAAVLGAVDDDRVRGVAVYGSVTDSRRLPWGFVEASEWITPWLQGMTPQGFEHQWRGLDAEFTPVEQVARLSPRPLLIIHAEDDEVVPIEQAHMLYGCAGTGCEIIVHPEANHAFVWHRGWLQEKLREWIRDF